MPTQLNGTHSCDVNFIQSEAPAQQSMVQKYMRYGTFIVLAQNFVGPHMTAL